MKIVRGIISSPALWIKLALGLASFGALTCWLYPHQICSARRACRCPGSWSIEVPQFFQSDPSMGRGFAREYSRHDGCSGMRCFLSRDDAWLSMASMSTPDGSIVFLTDHGGYEGEGWLKWESAAQLTPGIVEKAYEDLPSYARIDWNLLHGNPVIVRIRRIDGITHFVVIVGKRGF
jgi:hypothetical protein